METNDTWRDVYTVSRLNREARSALELSFPLIWIEGEISNLAQPPSGHLYFSLKDEQAQVRCALFRNQFRNLACRPRNGMQVLARARVSLYEGRGEFQLIVDSLEEAGEGALRRAFEALKLRLAEAGLFASEHKRPLPRLPRRIGVITSPSGAVIHDILTTLRRRFPAIPVLVYPVPVQGQGAAERIAAALRLASQRGDCDALILARGGGSLEDLWAFNEEVVARAVYDSRIPVVCGVGHETDITIADLVADARAPTPTAAAEILSPNQLEWLNEFQQKALRLQRLIQDELRDRQQRLDWLTARLIDPRTRVLRTRERVNDLLRRLRLAEAMTLQRAAAALAARQARLHQASPRARIREHGMRCAHLREKLERTMAGVLQALNQRLLHTVRGLNALSPLATLERGYAIVQDETRTRVIRDSREVDPGAHVHARLHRGALLCRVERCISDDE